MLNDRYRVPRNYLKGFTLVEMVVVLLILAILSASVIPSMLGFVNDAKKNSLASEARAVYTALQAYAAECFGKGISDEDIEDEVAGEVSSIRGLNSLLQGDATGVISKTKVQDGKIKSFRYLKDNIKADYSVDSGMNFVLQKSTTFAIGRTVNQKIKLLANNVGANYSTVDNNIHRILKADRLDESVNTSNDGNIISSIDAQYKIYAWYKEGNIYYYSEANNLCLNEDSSCMFGYLSSLTDIDTLKDWDTSGVTNLNGMFCECANLSEIDALSSWDVKNVTDLGDAFCGCVLLGDVSVLSRWKTSNVDNLRYMFASTAVADATCLSRWKLASGYKSYKAFNNTPANTNGKLPSWY